VSELPASHDAPARTNPGPTPRLTTLWQVRRQSFVYLVIACVSLPAFLIPMPDATGIILALTWLALVAAAWWVWSLRFAHPVLELRWDRAEWRQGRRDRRDAYRFDHAWQIAGGDPNHRHDEVCAVLEPGWSAAGPQLDHALDPRG
jgi:hypothetical protein